MGCVSSCFVLPLSIFLPGQRGGWRKSQDFFPVKNFLLHVLKLFVLWSKIAPQTQEITIQKALLFTSALGSKNSWKFLLSSQARLTLSPEQFFSPVFVCCNRLQSLSHRGLGCYSSSWKCSVWDELHNSEQYLCDLRGKTEFSYCLT